MLKITVPRIGSEQKDEFEFDPNSVTNREAMALEKATGMTFGQWSDALVAGSALAMTGVLWLIQRRVLPQLKFSEVEFPIAGIDVEDLTAVEEDAAPTGPTDEVESGDETGTTSPDDA